MSRPILIAVAVLFLAGCTAQPAPDRSPTDTAAGAAGDPCLVGSWVTAEGQTAAFLEHLATAQFADRGLTDVTADGEMTVAFSDDGTFTYEPDVAFSLTLPKGDPLPGTVTGQAGGAWSTKDGTVFANATTNGVVLTLTMNGKQYTGDTYGWTTLPISASRYECGGDQLTLTFNLGAASEQLDLVPAG